MVFTSMTILTANTRLPFDALAKNALLNAVGFFVQASYCSWIDKGAMVFKKNREREGFSIRVDGLL